MKTKCPSCGILTTQAPKKQWNRDYCPNCKKEERNKRQKTIMTNCYICGKAVECKGYKPWRTSLAKAKEGTACCSEKCTKEALRRGKVKSGKWLSDYNEKYASERMKNFNPMFKQENIEKMKSVKRANGTLNVWPGIRGGNGHYTQPQILLATALGWKMEVAVKTGNKQRDGSGFPTCYKVDVGNPKLKIGIEADGPGHTKKQKILDNKKDQKLIGMGWKILRFTNKEIMENLGQCVRTVMSTISKLKSTTTTSPTEY